MNEKKTCLKLRALLLAAATVIAVSACGGGSDGGGPAPTPSAPPPPPPTPPPVSNTVPVAAFSSAATGVAGSPVVFDASASADADGDALTYSWAFGNGLRGGGRNIAHVFDAAGNYTVRLTVDDGRGGSAFVERSVSVTPGPAAVGSVDTLAIVRDATGTPLAGVTVGVVNGSASAATGADGRATLATARGAPVTLKFSRSGYADQFKRFTLPVAAESGYIEVTMLAREPAQTLADAAAGGTLTGKNGARITLPPASLVDANGNPVSGPVQIAMTPVDVAAEARAFPGRFEGVGPDGTEGLILSYGTVEFILTQNNAPVQLAPGKKAAIEIPVYTALNRDRTPVRVGDTYPLWSLNERTGTWVQEGTGTVVAASTPSDLALRGEVTHFSWWNHDIFDVPPYKPKPRCLVDTNYDGIPEDLTNTGYCSHEASPFWENQQAASSGQVRAQAEPRTQRIPAWVASTSTPVAGGVELPVPADMDIVFQSYALNGSLYARTLVRGASGASQDIDIVLQPVQNASGTVPITLPWNQVYAMSHAGEVDRFSLAAQAGQSFTIVAGRSNSSILGGNVVVRNPAGAAVGSAALGAGNASITINNAVAGTYTIEVAATANAPGAYRLQAQPLSSNCASAAALVLPTDATHPMTPNSALCFTLDLAADQVIDLDLPSRGSLSGSLQLRAPSDEVIARDTFQNGVARVPGLRLGVAQAGRYQVEIVNNSTASGTVRLRGSNLAAQQISLPQQVTVTDMGSGETRRFVLKRPSPAADFAAALAACNGSFTAGVYPTRTFTSVNFTSSCATGRAVRIQAHAMNALVLPVIDIARNSTTVQTPGEFTLTTSTPTPVALDNDVRLTAPPEAGAIAYTFEGTIGQEVTLGNDVPGSSTSPSPVSVRINAPDGTALLGTGSAGIFTLPLAGLYTVEVANPSSYIGSLRFRLNSVTAPVPLTLTPPLTERSDTLALGQVRRYTFDLNQAEVFTLRLASPDTLSASASVGDTTSGSATVLLTGNTAPQFASTGGSYARTTGQRVLVVRSSSSAEARSTGAFTVGVQKPVPIATALGAAFAGSVTARQMLSYGIAIPTAGYHVLRWQHTAATSGQVDLSATLWAPTTPFANYTGELSIFGGEVVGGSRAGENVTLLQTGSHTLTALNRNDSGTIDYTMSLVALEAPVDLVTGGAATSGSIGVAGERDYYRFAGTASQSYTLNVTAGFGGNVYVRRLPGSGNYTDRAATTLATFPRVLSAGVPLSAAFTIPADQGGVYIVEIDGDQAATGSYTVQLTSP